MMGRGFDRVLLYGIVLALWAGSWGNISTAAAGQNGQRKPSDSVEGGSRRRGEEKDSRERKEQDDMDNSGENGEEQEPRKQVSFGSVPYFKDDSGNNTQLVEGWLYGYWSRQLCRIHPQTLETEVLFEADSPQEGYFSIYEGMIYFVEQKNISYLNGARANLWRMECDGSGQELLVEDFQIGEGYAIGDSALTDLEIHDDILYLLARFSGEDENLYFRLQEDGSAEEISAAETLYGMVPEGFSEARAAGYRYSYLPNLVYCVRNFGYAFVCDEEGKLYRIILETGEKEKIPFGDEDLTNNLTLTNEALVYRSDDKWYARSLDDLKEVREIGVLDCYQMTFWDDKGIYDVERNYGDDSFSIIRLNWNGERETIDYWVQNPRLGSSVYGDYLTVLYADGDYLYYDNLLEGDGVICRIALEKKDAYEYDDESECVFIYYENPLKKIAAEETFSSTFTANATGARGSFSLTKVYLTEKSEAARKINEYLEEIYQSEQEYMAELMDAVRDMSLDDLFGSDLTVVEDELNLHITYLDENYIGVSAFWYECWSGAAHGMYGSTEYVFSRSSGERVLIADYLENSPEEICTIIAPYVEARAEWGTDAEGWEQMILEEGRFYLTTEGIGIHFDTYELTCYASGGLDVVIPYELFDLRDPADVGLTSF